MMSFCRPTFLLDEKANIYSNLNDNFREVADIPALLSIRRRLSDNKCHKTEALAESVLINKELTSNLESGVKKK